MNIEKMREEFEEALIAMHVSTGLPRSTAKAMVEVKCNGQYASPSTMGAWWAWQASRAAIEVELPVEDDTRCDTVAEEARQEAYNQGVGECRFAIESLGLKVKA